jgi:hypothetical protein
MVMALSFSPDIMPSEIEGDPDNRETKRNGTEYKYLSHP